MKVLVSLAEGLGNIVEGMPLIWSLQANGIEVELWYDCNFSGCGSVISTLSQCKVHKIGEPIPDIESFDGRIETMWSVVVRRRFTAPEKSSLKVLNNINKQKFDITPIEKNGFDVMKFNNNETDIFTDIIFELINEPVLVYNRSHTFHGSLKPTDFVLHNGFNYTNNTWARKSYKYWPEVVRILLDNDYTVCSIGAKHEHIEGTSDYTGKNLYDVVGVINDDNSIYAGNDSGIYHVAGAVGSLGIVNFTATSVNKNYHPVFHKSIKAIKPNIDCRPCHNSLLWQACNDWKCRETDPKEIAEYLIHLAKNKEHNNLGLTYIPIPNCIKQFQNRIENVVETPAPPVHNINIKKKKGLLIGEVTIKRPSIKVKYVENKSIKIK